MVVSNMITCNAKEYKVSVSQDTLYDFLDMLKSTDAFIPKIFGKSVFGEDTYWHISFAVVEKTDSKTDKKDV